jgi:trehalose 2-sulfotransferase
MISIDYQRELSPSQSYVLCTNMRSGSSHLAALLQSTGVLGFPDEWLRGDGGPGPDGHEPYPTDVEQQMRVMLRAGATPNGVCALKMFPHHFDQTLASRWAERMPGLKFVQLIRRDLLGHAISLSIAHQTESYNHLMPERRTAFYSREHIQHCMDYLAAGNARWELFFARNGIFPLLVTYEAVCEDPQAVVGAIGRHVGVPEASIGELPMELRVQRSQRTSEWRARFIAETHDLAALPQCRGWAVAEPLKAARSAPEAESLAPRPVHMQEDCPRSARRA